MVGTVRPDEYSALMRRIGYSVGLEKLRERYSSLVDLYAERKKFETGDYIELTEKIWEVPSGLKNREKKRAEHMADVYRALGLFDLTQLQAQPLPGLDLAAITAQLASNYESRETSKDAVLLHLLVEADSDIFLNLLDSNFQPEESEKRLLRLVETKRSSLSPLFSQRDIREKVLSHIEFKSQTSASNAKLNKPFFEQRVYAFAPDVPTKLEISSDLLDKAIQTRKKWAEALGLWAGGKTDRAHALLRGFRNLGLKLGEDGPIVIWPYDHTLKTFRIFPEKAGIVPPSRWDISVVIAATVFNADVITEVEEEQRDFVVKTCRAIFDLYKSADALRSKIRAQVPLFVLEPAFAIHCAAEQKRILPLREYIEIERRDARRRMQLTPIRGADGGIIVSNADI